MARNIERLKTGAIARATRRGLHPDGAGLYLQVGPTGGRSWIYRYTLRGRTRYMGLGAAGLVSLREARRKALSCRRLAADGQDPLEIRRQQSPKRPKAPTFKEAAEAFIAANESGWRNARQAAQWRSSPPDASFDQFSCWRNVGVDETNGRFADVRVDNCVRCGTLWLRYFVEYEAFSRSGRWARGSISADEARSITPETAEEHLSTLPEYLADGSYFAGRKHIGKGRLWWLDL
jgi:hypothetical protein